MRRHLLPILALTCPLIATATDPNAGIPDDCPELRVDPVRVPEDQNAYAILSKLPPRPKGTVERPESFYDLNLFWKLRAKTEKPTGIIIAKARVLLARHAETMRLWDAAIAAPHFVEPTVSNNTEAFAVSSENNFSANLEALFGNIWRIRIATYEGRHTDAFNDWLRLRTAILNQADQPGTLLASMIRSVELGVINKEAWVLQPTSAEARRCRPQPVKFPTLAYKGTIRSEARYGVVALPESDGEILNLISTFTYPVNRFKEHGIATVADYRLKVQPLLGDKSTRARETRDEIRRMESGDLGDPLAYKRKLAEDSAYNLRNRATTDYFSHSNIFDLIYFSRWADAISCTQADLVIALRAYAEEHEGKLPQKLDELVPDYADAVPLDPFDGKPIRYDAKTPKLWSIGPDFTDDRGQRDNPLRFSDRTGDITSWPPNIPMEQPVENTEKAVSDGYK